MQDTEKAVAGLGVDLLRELHAVAWFCDTSRDGRLHLISKSHRGYWQADGPSRPLVDAGCVRLIARGRFVRMEQFGRRVLRRAEAMGLDLDPPAAEDDE